MSGLNSYRKKHGGPVAIVAPGPSIKGQLEQLKNLPAERVIAVNTGIEAVPHAEYTVSGDREVAGELAVKTNVLFVIDGASPKAPKKDLVVFKGRGPWELDYGHWNTSYGWRPKRFKPAEAHHGELRWGFSLHDIDTEGLYTGRTSTYLAITMALWMGFDEIYLFGVDLGYKGKDTHFYGTKAVYDKWNPEGWFQLTKDALESLAPHLYDLKVTMFNCSPDSRLKLYPYMDYETACSRICSS